MMRDPSITQGPDGTFHLVWTISWNGEQGFGYASSKDLIHWSEQREIKVMKDSLTNNVWAPEVFYEMKGTVHRCLVLCHSSREIYGSR